MEDTAIRCKGIKKFYGDKDDSIEALKGIDLDIYKGQLTLLVGPSGSGKSTLLSILTLLLSPDAGEIWLLGKHINGMSDFDKTLFRRNTMGIVFQSFFLIPMLSVVENVALPLVVAGQPEREAQEKAHEVLKKLGLDSRSQVSPSLLSKGQQQRVAIARAMVNDSQIIVCDEPTSSLDQTNGHEAMNLLHEFASDPRRAVLVVTHDHRIFPFASRIIEMNDGQITTGEAYA